MTKAVLFAFGGAMLIAVSTDPACSSMAFDGGKGTGLSSPNHAERNNFIEIADNQNEAPNKKKNSRRCQNLIANCQFPSNPQKEARICTSENVAFMNEHCLGKGKK